MPPRGSRSGRAVEPHPVPMLPNHTLTPIIEHTAPDETVGYAACSCGWESRSVKSCWIDDQFARHIEDVRP